MVDLSQQAQAVLDAFNHEARPEPHHQREAIAAAIRAAVNQVECDMPGAKVFAAGYNSARADLLAIAAYLEVT